LVLLVGLEPGPRLQRARQHKASVAEASATP